MLDVVFVGSGKLWIIGFKRKINFRKERIFLFF